ncbi:MAG: mechanosensitive ion channel [Saprospiraceae bacterium]|nr:mechanosensitive ion channel [Saprospiraceae bacterium]
MTNMFFLLEVPDWLANSAVGVARSVGLALITVILGFWLANRVADLIGSIMKKREMDETLRPFIVSLVRTVFKIFVLVTAAATLGIETTSFAAALGAVFLAIGMALQGSLANFAGGFLMLVFRPFKVGDLIEAQGFLGVVKEIQIFNTIILTLDNKTVIIPNGPLSNGTITNVTQQDEIRVDMTFGISYDSSIDEARRVIQEVANSCEHIPNPGKTDIFVGELADSSVNFVVRPWAKPAHFWDVYFYMHENIKKEFDKAGVSMPYPQMDVHVNQVKG